VSVLTVGEMDQFATRGGMIQFSLEEKQVRFDINLEEASQAGLKISSRLFILSRIVKDQGKNQSAKGRAENSNYQRKEHASSLCFVLSVFIISSEGRPTDSSCPVLRA